MHHKTIAAGLSLAFLLVCIPQTLPAQEEDAPAHMFSLIEVSVKPGQERDFRNGIAAWKACYLENDGSSNWNVWRRMNGEGIGYTVAFQLSGWADLDETDDASQACQAVVRDQITPHTDSSKGSFIRFMPNISKQPAVAEVIWVTSFRTTDDRKFRQTVTKVTDSVSKLEGEPRGYWYSVQGGGPKEAQYMVVVPFESFAAIEAERKNVWQVLADDLGQEQADRVRTDAMDATDSLWSHLYRRVADLSHQNED